MNSLFGTFYAFPHHPTKNVKGVKG